jgi:hypothetical protein
MPPRKRRFVAITCEVDDIETVLETYGAEYDLLGMSAYQVGIGFGAKVNAVLAFRLREKNEETASAVRTDAVPNGSGAKSSGQSGIRAQH